MSKYPVVGICGQAGTGKDAVADILVKEFYAEKLAFAAPMKELAVKFFPHENVYGSSEKRNEQVSVPELNFHTFLQEEVHALVEGSVQFGGQFKINPVVQSWCSQIVRHAHENGGKMSARHFLQQLGTELGRQLNPNIWVEKGMARAEASLQFIAPFVVITDVRFRNEALAIKKAGGVLLKIVGTGISTTNDTHASEREQNSIPYFWFDHEFVNSKDGLDRLTWKVRNALEPGKLFGV